MNKYTRMNWENTPSTATPLTADNLNHMDEGIERATDGAIALETEIATARGDSADLNTRFTADEASLGAVKSEITTARGGQNSLGARLDTADANLAKKANKSDIDSINSRLQSTETTLKNKANIADVSNSLAKKADKSTTLAGYGISDAYTQEETNKKLARKLDSMPFDSEPKNNSPCYLTSGTVYSALTKKFDSSNIETGKGKLTPAEGCEGYEGSFNYSKIGKTVTVALNIIALADGYSVHFTGLPFPVMTASKMSSIAVYTPTGTPVNIRIGGTWLDVSSKDGTFADGEKINAIITYIIG